MVCWTFHALKALKKLIQIEILRYPIQLESELHGVEITQEHIYLFWVKLLRSHYGNLLKSFSDLYKQMQALLISPVFYFIVYIDNALCNVLFQMQHIFWPFLVRGYVVSLFPLRPMW